MTLGQRIYSLRRERKLSQEVLAEKLNVSRQAVSKWENDLSAPDTENLILLAQILGTDVEFLATGVLPEDLETEPVPEPAEEPKQPGRNRKRLPAIVLALSLIFNVVLFALLQYERQNEAKLETYCTACLYGAKERFADFAHDGEDVDYWQGVAEFRGFMQAYHLLLEDQGGGEYNWLNRLYTSMLFRKDKVTENLEQLRKVLRLLYEDYTDISALEELSRLNNEIEHGE